MIDPAALAELQDVANATLDQPCAVIRDGTILPWSMPDGAPLRCGVGVSLRVEAFPGASRLEGLPRLRLFLPAILPGALRDGDWIQTADGVVYAVTGVQAPRSYPAYTACVAHLLQNSEGLSQVVAANATVGLQRAGADLGTRRVRFDYLGQFPVSVTAYGAVIKAMAYDSPDSPWQHQDVLVLLHIDRQAVLPEVVQFQILEVQRPGDAMPEVALSLEGVVV